jgi:hypothetical protein
VWLPADEELQGEKVIEGVLLVIEHKEWIAPSGIRFEGFVEFRLVGARVRQ